MRASTYGCTEWSCIYHGLDNRLKSKHDTDCPVRSYTGALKSRVVPDCTCQDEAEAA